MSQRCTVRLPDTLYEFLQIEADARQCGVSDLIREGLERLLGLEIDPKAEPPRAPKPVAMSAPAPHDCIETVLARLPMDVREAIVERACLLDLPASKVVTAMLIVQQLRLGHRRSSSDGRNSIGNGSWAQPLRRLHRLQGHQYQPRVLGLELQLQQRARSNLRRVHAKGQRLAATWTLDELLPPRMTNPPPDTRRTHGRRRVLCRSPGHAISRSRSPVASITGKSPATVRRLTRSRGSMCVAMRCLPRCPLL